jgi:RNA polymerase sigma factor (sigma-70 family)
MSHRQLDPPAARSHSGVVGGVGVRDVGRSGVGCHDRGPPTARRDVPDAPAQSTEVRDVEPWAVELLRGDAERAWDLFVDRYRRLIFSAIRRYALEHDEVMDVFASVCGALREGDLARLRGFVANPSPRARFSTWLVAVVRNQTIDWFRRRDGRRRLTVPAALSGLQGRIYEHVFHDGRSHIEAFEIITTRDGVALTWHEYSRELVAVYRVAYDGRRAPLLRELGAPAPLFGAAQPDDQAMEADSVRRIGHALDALDDAERLAIQLFVVEEMPAVDVALTVGWPNAKAVYNKVNRALGSVRVALERRGIRRDDL